MILNQPLSLFHFWFFTVIKHTSIPIWAVKLSVKIYAFFGTIIGLDVGFDQQFVITMGKCTLWAKFTFTSHFPIPTHLSLEFLLKILGGSYQLFWLNSLKVNVLLIYIFLIRTRIWICLRFREFFFFLFWFCTRILVILSS